jgi:Zn-dependent peptidase ImmA (M78 family)/transcriptional regulator with XRE-family HTH domain
MADSDNLFHFSSSSVRRADSRRLNPSKLRDARLAKRLNQSELASKVGITRQAISAYEQGEKSPESGTMTRIAEELEQPLSFFIADELPTFGVQSARFHRAIGPETKRRNLACDVLGKWFVQVAKYFDGLINYPKVDVPTASPASEGGRYSEDEIESAALECRRVWGLGHGPISNVVTLLEGKGIIVGRYEIPDERVEAFSFWNGDRPFVFLSSEKRSAARSRFDTAHELGHLVLHRWVGPDELENGKTLKVIEREADRFAGAFLAPAATFSTEIYTTRLDAFVALKRRWKVSVQALVYRCKNLRIFDDDQVTNLYKQISARRWKTWEPLDDPNDLPLEQPKLLARATDLIVRGGVKTTEDIGRELQISTKDIEQFCNFPPGFLAAKTSVQEFRPTLKLNK